MENLNWNFRILVVEDEPGIAKAYEQILVPKKSVALKSSRTKNKEATMSNASQFNFEITVCHTAQEALSAVQQSIATEKPFAMGFFDVMLGAGMDGFELVKEIHKLDSNMYSVFVTAYNDRSIESIHEFLGSEKANRWDYLNKPFIEGEILQKARNFVSLWNLHNENELKTKQLSDIQKRLMESERMTSVAAVSRGVTHEFGNILMGIMGRAELAQDEEESEAKESMKKILNASLRAKDVLERFKALADNSTAMPAKENTSINQLLDDALELLDHRIKTSNIKICKIKNDPIEATVHPTPILQTIVNLTINAIHSMESGGQIDYAIENDGDHFVVRIRDYGTGIDPRFLEKVTEAFFTTKGKEGTGLGLAITKEIIEIEHGGSFTLNNHTTKGLEATIRIPKKPEEDCDVTSQDAA